MCVCIPMCRCMCFKTILWTINIHEECFINCKLPGRSGSLRLLQRPFPFHILNEVSILCTVHRYPKGIQAESGFLFWSSRVTFHNAWGHQAPGTDTQSEWPWTLRDDNRNWFNHRQCYRSWNHINLSDHYISSP